MAIDFQLRDTNGTSVITTIGFSPPIPIGVTYAARNGSWRKIWVRNVGTENLTNVNVEIIQSGTDNLYDYVTIAPDNGSGSPLTGSAVGPGVGGLNLGSLNVDQQKAVYINTDVPGTVEAGTQSFKLSILGTV